MRFEKKMKFTVTQDDIDRAKRDLENHQPRVLSCPVAQCVNRTIRENGWNGYLEVVVDEQDIIINVGTQNRIYKRYGVRLARFINVFDAEYSASRLQAAKNGVPIQFHPLKSLPTFSIPDKRLGLKSKGTPT